MSSKRWEVSPSGWRKLVRDLARLRRGTELRNLMKLAEDELATWPDELRVACMEDEYFRSLWSTPKLPAWAELIRALRVNPELIAEPRHQPSDISLFSGVTTLIMAGHWSANAVIRAIEWLPDLTRLLWERPVKYATISAVMAHSAVSRLTGVGFRDCLLMPLGFDAIVEAWKASSICELDLSGNFFLRDSALDQLCGVMDPSRLKLLNLSHNKFSGDAIGRFLHSANLQSLILSGVEIGGNSLARLLKNAHTGLLRQLFIDNTAAGPTVSGALRDLHLHHLELFSARLNGLEDTIVNDIIGNSSWQRTSVLHLEENLLTSEAIVKLRAAFPNAECGAPFPDWLGG